MPPQVAALLDSNRLALELVDAGARCEDCRYDLGMRQGVQGMLKRFGGQRALHLLVSLRTLDRVLAGDGDAAVDSLIGGLMMSRVFELQPILVAFLTKVSLVAIAPEDAVRVLERGAPSDAALARLDEAMGAADYLGGFQRAMFAERVFGLSYMQQCLTGPVRDGLLAGYLGDMASLVATAGQPWPQALDTMQQFEGENHFGRILVPAVTAGAASIGWGAAELRSTRVAVRVEQYRRAHGRLPEALAELPTDGAEELPPDPFSGGPLLYRADDGGYRVYSVGENRQDDGGDVGRDRESTDRGVRVRVGPASP